MKLLRVFGDPLLNFSILPVAGNNLLLSLNIVISEEAGSPMDTNVMGWIRGFNVSGVFVALLFQEVISRLSNKFNAYSKVNVIQAVNIATESNLFFFR